MVETFHQQYYITPRLGSGQQGRVYAISKGHVAKVQKRKFHPTGDPESLQKEYENAQDLYREGISVPKPEGIFPVQIRWLETGFGLLYPEKEAFVMERIRGRTMDSIMEANLYNKVEDLYLAELEKCAAAGFSMPDHTLTRFFGHRYKNAIYNQDQGKGKIYLIDFMNVTRR